MITNTLLTNKTCQVWPIQTSANLILETDACGNSILQQYMGEKASAKSTYDKEAMAIFGSFKEVDTLLIGS